jgi:hypothetical protein
MRTYTFLFAASAVPAMKTCGCLAGELGFKIDCTDQKTMEASYKALTKDCLTDCSSDACKKDWGIVETHHDFCLHDEVPHEVEVGFHDLEEKCAKSCTVGRKKDPDHKACDAMECPKDTALLETTVKNLADNGCDKKCDEAKCGKDFRTLRVLHDKCEAADAAEYEWAGIFATADKTHTWSMQKVGGAYADPAMKLVLFAVDTADEKTMDSLADKGSNLMRGTCADLKTGETMTPTKDGVCYNLVVDDTKDDTTYTIATDGIKGIAFYAQHVPTEFERDRHYLYDTKDVDIEPVAQESAGGHDHDHRRLVGADIDAALHLYEDSCDKSGCYVEVEGCAAADLAKVETLEERGKKKCFMDEEEATTCVAPGADASGAKPLTALTGVALVLAATMQ